MVINDWPKTRKALKYIVFNVFMCREKITFISIYNYRLLIIAQGTFIHLN